MAAICTSLVAERACTLVLASHQHFVLCKAIHIATEGAHVGTEQLFQGDAAVIKDALLRGGEGRFRERFGA